MLDSYPKDKLSQIKRVYRFYLNSKNEPCLEKDKVVYINREYAFVASHGCTDVFRVGLDKIFTSYDEYLKMRDRTQIISFIARLPFKCLYFYDDPMIADPDENIARLENMGALARTYGMFSYAACKRSIDNYTEAINKCQSQLEDFTQRLTNAMNRKEELEIALNITESDQEVTKE